LRAIFIYNGGNVTKGDNSLIKIYNILGLRRCLFHSTTRGRVASQSPVCGPRLPANGGSARRERRVSTLASGRM